MQLTNQLADINVGESFRDFTLTRKFNFTRSVNRKNFK